MATMTMPKTIKHLPHEFHHQRLLVAGILGTIAGVAGHLLGYFFGSWIAVVSLITIAMAIIIFAFRYDEVILGPPR